MCISKVFMNSPWWKKQLLQKVGTSKFIIVINKCHTCLWFEKKKKKKQTNYFSFNVCGKGNTVPINAQTSASSCVIPSFHA